MSDTIQLLDLVAQYKDIKPEIDQAIQRVVDSGWFILGDEVAAIEQEVADYLGVRFGVGVASGTDALILALRALEVQEGDEVIIPSYTFFATAGAVLHVGASPVLVDVDPETYCLDIEHFRKAITNKTRAVIPVHLYGHPVEMDSLLITAREYDIKVIEDNAQAFGALYKGKKTGGLGDVGCLSFFPSKNLGGYGDGGMVVTNSEEIADQIRMLRVHGWKTKYYPQVLGYNSRLDALQAAVLRVKLRHLDAWNQKRNEIAKLYNQALRDHPIITAPYAAEHVTHAYHLYVLRTSQRDRLENRLKKAGVSSGVYYPQALHLTKPMIEYGYKRGDFPVSEISSDQSLAIPVYPEMSEVQIERVIEVLKEIK